MRGVQPRRGTWILFHILRDLIDRFACMTMPSFRSWELGGVVDMTKRPRRVSEMDAGLSSVLVGTRAITLSV